MHALQWATSLSGYHFVLFDVGVSVLACLLRSLYTSQTVVCGYNALGVQEHLIFSDKRLK